jgi:murein DD-endopeptidase MepM/ murein hydrolase activator NlpD
VPGGQAAAPLEPPNRRGATPINHVHRAAGGYEVLYAHFNDFAPGLREGQQIAQGQVIGFAGSTGNSTAAHLHVTWPIRSAGWTAMFPVLGRPFLLGTGGEAPARAARGAGRRDRGAGNQAVVERFKIRWRAGR